MATSGSYYQSSSPVVIDPTQSQGFSNVLNQFQGLLSGLKVPDYASLVNQGVQSPLMQSVLQPSLAQLSRTQDLSRQNFMDQFRSAGALGSSAMGTGSANLENVFQGQDANLISQVLSTMLPQFIQGYNTQFQNQLAIPGLLSQALGATRPLVGQSSVGQGGMTGGTPSIADSGVGNYQPGNVFAQGGGGSGGGYGGMGSSGAGAGAGAGGATGAYPVGESGGYTYYSDGSVKLTDPFLALQGQGISGNIPGVGGGGGAGLGGQGSNTFYSTGGDFYTNPANQTSPGTEWVTSPDGSFAQNLYTGDVVQLQ